MPQKQNWVFFMKNVVFFMPEGSYSTTRYFTKRLGSAMEDLGVKVQYLDFQEIGVLEVIERVQKDPVDFTCTFNAILPLHDGRLFCDHLEVPHLNCLVDMSMDALYLLKSPYSVIACVDAFFSQYLKNSGFDRAFFLPHAADDSGPCLTESEKKYDFVFMGTCFDHEKIAKEWPEHFSKKIADVLLQTANRVLSDDRTCHLFALFEALEKESLSPAELPLVDLFQQFERYLKGRSRAELLQSLEGLNVDVFGSGHLGSSWESSLAGMDKVNIHEALDFKEALRVMAQSKIVLNSSPFFKYGAHERIVYGLCSGASVASDENLFMKKHFSKEDGVLFYRPWDLAPLRENLQKHLENSKEREAWVSNGRDKVLQDHSWASRARHVLDKMTSILGNMKKETVR